MASPNVLVRLKFYKPEDIELNMENPINAAKAKKRTFYSSNQKDGDDYLKYIDKGAKAGEVYDYMAYAGNEEKSSGVFGKDGFLTEKQKKEIRGLLRTTKSVIWDMLISFTEDYGNKHIKSYLDAMEVIKHNLPKFFRDNGMKYENVIWFAGLHENTDNKHIHLSFFEKEPLMGRQNKQGLFYHTGKMKKYSIDRLKIFIEEQLNGNEYFLESYRQNLLLQTNVALQKRGYDLLDKKLRLKLKELYRKFPSGRISYNSLNMVELRPLIREIERILLEKNPLMSEEYQALRKALDAKDNELKEICQRQHIDETKYLQKEKFIEDFHRRIGNKIIQYTKEYIYEERRNEKAVISEKAKRNIEKTKRMRLFKETARLTREVDYEAIDIFTEYRKRLAEAEYQRLIEEGVIEVD